MSEGITGEISDTEKFPSFWDYEDPEYKYTTEGLDALYSRFPDEDSQDLENPPNRRHPDGMKPVWWPKALTTLLDTYHGPDGLMITEDKERTRSPELDGSKYFISYWKSKNPLKVSNQLPITYLTCLIMMKKLQSLFV